MDLADHRATLLGMIDDLIEGRWSLSDFEEQFYWYFHDQLPAGALEASELDFFFEVAEKLDRVVDDPSVGPKLKGWLDAERSRRRAWPAGR